MNSVRIAEPAFWINKIPVFGDLVLAPMDGISSYPFRSLTRTLGSAASYTEFISAVDAIHLVPRLRQHIYFTDEERPVIFQLLDNDVERLTRAAEKLATFRPDAIDINLGCPARDIAGRGAGAGLLRSPEKIAQIILNLRSVVTIPITVKMRLGWDSENLNFLEVAKVVQESGAALIAVHGRTRKQAYTGSADWDAIAAVKQAVNIPVLANGDVRTVADINRIKAHTGCDGVMIGRAALGNPWIFSRLDREEVSPALFRQTIFEHLNRNLTFFGPEQGLIRYRKHILYYLKNAEIPHEIRLEMLTTVDVIRFITIVESLLPSVYIGNG